MSRIVPALTAAAALTICGTAAAHTDVIVPATALNEAPQEFPFGGDPDFTEIPDNADVEDDIDEETGVTTTTITLPGGQIIVIRHATYQGTRAADFAAPPAEYDSTTGEQTWDDTSALYAECLAWGCE